MSVFQAFALGGQIGFALGSGLGPYRPSGWDKPQLTSITVSLPGLPEATVTTSDTFSTAVSTTEPATSTLETFYFDAVLRVEHAQDLVATEHPVQVGPAIVDHAYLRPAMVILDIGMSDAMDSFVSGQYSSDASKSISAYLKLKEIQAARVPIVLATRLDVYPNMLIDSIRVPDSSATIYGLRATVHFRQIVTAAVSTSKGSARPDQTGATNEGVKAPQPSPPTYTPLANIP